MDPPGLRARRRRRLFPFGRSSPAFRALDLEAAGVVWHNADFESCHPALDGSHACIARDVELGARHFGSDRDGEAWRKLAQFHRSIEPRLLEALMDPFPALAPALKLGAVNLLRVASMFAQSGRRLSRGLFRTKPRAPGTAQPRALHVDVGPDDWFGSGLGYMLGLTASTGGYAVPRGGAQSITNALVTILERQGGRLQLGARVSRIEVRGRRAVGVVLANGEQISAARAVLADTSAPSLCLNLLESGHVPNRMLRKMRKFPLGFGTFNSTSRCRTACLATARAALSAVVHAGESLDDLSRFVREVRAGKIPEAPVPGGRAAKPDRPHTRATQRANAVRLHARAVGGRRRLGRRARKLRRQHRATHQGLAPGFRSLVLARKAHAPPDLERMNANLIGGDLGGGSNAWNRQLLFRPMFPYFRYRMPVERLYLCSSYAHPGAGVHGMCGYNAARIAMKDIE